MRTACGKYAGSMRRKSFEIAAIRVVHEGKWRKFMKTGINAVIFEIRFLNEKCRGLSSDQWNSWRNLSPMLIHRTPQIVSFINQINFNHHQSSLSNNNFATFPFEKSSQSVPRTKPFSNFPTVASMYWRENLVGVLFYFILLVCLILEWCAVTDKVDKSSLITKSMEFSGIK